MNTKIAMLRSGHLISMWKGGGMFLHDFQKKVCIQGSVDRYMKSGEYVFVCM